MTILGKLGRIHLYCFYIKVGKMENSGTTGKGMKGSHAKICII